MKWLAGVKHPTFIDRCPALEVVIVLRQARAERGL
jgi:hypothetical protein